MPRSIILLSFLVLWFPVLAQSPATQAAEQSGWLEGGAGEAFSATPPLPYPDLRPADVMWSKRVWRVIDTREKLNHPLRAPERSLFDVIEQGIRSGAITAYSPEDDRFSHPLHPDSLLRRFHQLDTVTVIDPVTNQPRLQVVENTFDPADILRWRLQEVWYFDSRYSQLRVRLIGIAPLLQRRNELGEVKYESPMCWIRYAEARPWLAGYPVPLPGNDQAVLSWEDFFEMRRFHGAITRESNLLGQRLQDYLSGVDLLLQAERIDQEIQAFGMNVWEE